MKFIKKFIIVIVLILIAGLLITKKIDIVPCLCGSLISEIYYIYSKHINGLDEEKITIFLLLAFWGLIILIRTFFNF